MADERSDYEGPDVRRRAVLVTGATGLGAFAGCLQQPADSRTETVDVASLLPITGALSAFGPGIREGVELAVADVNAAGGLLGHEIVHHRADSQTDPEDALDAYELLVEEHDIVGFVGAASSDVSVPLAKRVASDEVFQCSPSSTTPTLTDMGYENGTRYVGRTAPNDGQIGTTMAYVMNRYVGADTASFLHVNNAYGKGLAQKAKEAFDGETLRLVPYSSKTTDYTSTIDELFEGDPDGVGFVGYTHPGRDILRTWESSEYEADWVLSEGLNSPKFFQDVSDVVEGMYVASPDPVETRGTSTFRSKIDGSPTIFAPHAYDATFLMALAIHRAGKRSGTAIANHVRAVSRGPGTRVTVGEFEKATDLLDANESVNYEGASGHVDLTAALEPLYRHAVLRIGDDGTTEEVETIAPDHYRGRL